MPSADHQAVELTLARIVDPIDGTVNMVHMCKLLQMSLCILNKSYRSFTVPMIAISIGFCINSIPVVGVVFAPFLGGDGS